MTWGADSSPARFGYGQSTTNDRQLFLDVFGGETLTAFDLSTITLDKHNVKTVGGGQKSWRFPKTWKATAEYHTPGKEMLGNDIDTSEIQITVDDILVSHTAISDIDSILSHFDVRSEFSKQMGRSLARVFDKNVFRQLSKAARTAADGPFPGGMSIVNAALTNNDNATGGVDGKAWIDAIRNANIQLFQKDIPEDTPRFLAVNAYVFDAIKFARGGQYVYNGTTTALVKDAGEYLMLDKDYGPNVPSGFGKRAEMIEVDGVYVYKTRNMPTTNETADTSVYSKYRADYSKVSGLLWTPDAVATVKVMDIGFEVERDTRRLEDFMVAKMLVGHGTLRPECAIEFKVA